MALLPFADDCEISRYPQAIFTPPVAIPEGLGHAYGMLAAPPNNDGKKPLIAGRFEHLSALPSMAAEGDLVVTIPRRQALQWQAALGLRIIGKPLPPIEICITWSPLLEADLAHRWFRNLFRGIIGDDVPAGL